MAISDVKMEPKRPTLLIYIYIFRKTAKVSCPQNSTINICTLDISKAFDKVNRNKLIL